MITRLLTSSKYMYHFPLGLPNPSCAVMNLEEQFLSSGFINPYVPTPSNDLFLFNFIVTYLVVVKGFSLESILDFTIYDFINCVWNLNYFETGLLNIYFRYIRINWISKGGDITVFKTSPCGFFVGVTGIFFVNPNGVADFTVDKEIAEDILNRNAIVYFSSGHVGKGGETSISAITRPRRRLSLSIVMMRNCTNFKENIYEKCMLQQWTNVEVKEKCPEGRGRGIVTTQNFQKNDIIVDYHARVISKDTMKQILNDDRSRYLFCSPGGLFWDGSSESCICHPQSRLLGRLANFADAKNTMVCNVKPQLFEFKPLKSPVFRTILLVATRDIEPFEEIRFDYGDNTCVELFKTI